jgi:hypothetical protein
MIMRGQRSIDEMLEAVQVTRDPALVRTIFSNLDSFSGRFSIVEP